MMNKYLGLLGLILMLALVACGADTAAPVVSGDGVSDSRTDTAVVVENNVDTTSANEISSTNETNEAVETTSISENMRLDDSYNDALPVQSQLAIGTLQLDNGELAIDESLAAELLPLWRAVQSLANSETTATAEVTAVLNQIQDTMNPEQVATIAAMQLTDESFQAMLADGTISMRGAFGGNRGADGAGNGGFAGGGPGGGLPGGGQGGPGGGPGGLGGDDPSAVQTRIAERTAEGGGDFANFQTTAMTGAVIRLLETKTGELPADNFGRGGIFAQAITAVSESTGLSEEAIQTALSEGNTLTEIIAENGGDLDAVKASLAEGLADSEFLQGQDVDEFITNFLEGGGSNGRSGNTGNE